MPKSTSDCCATGCKRLWPKVRLGDVCEIVAGQSPEGVYYTNDSKYTEFHQGSKAFGPVSIQPSGVFTKVVTKLAPAGSILMSVRAPVGDLNITDRQICIGRGLASFAPSAQLIRVYLFYSLLSAKDALEKTAGAGACFASISTKQLSNFTIPLPPLAEQKKIVEKVEKALKRVDALKAQFERMEKSAADYFKAALAETFAAVKGEKVKLGDVCEFMNGDRGANYPAKSKLSHNGEIPFISALNLENRTVVTDRLMYLSQQQYDALRAGKLKKGDIALCIRGSLGKFCIYPFERGAIASSLVILRCGPKLDVNFLANYLESAEFYRQVGRDDHGTAQPNLAAKSVMMFDINLPVLGEQKCVVRTLDAAKLKSERMVMAARRGIEICGKMRKAILAEAFQ